MPQARDELCVIHMVIGLVGRRCRHSNQKKPCQMARLPPFPSCPRVNARWE